MFNLKKVVKARKRLEFLTSILFKFFQISLRYKESRKNYGIEIFEYFYLPWRTEKDFNNYFNAANKERKAIENLIPNKDIVTNKQVDSSSFNGALLAFYKNEIPEPNAKQLSQGSLKEIFL